MSASETTKDATAETGIDVRGPRFTAGITAVLLLITVVLGLTGDPANTVLVQPGFLLLLALTLLFAWGAFAGVKRHPFGLLFKRFVLPRLSPTTEREDPKPPTFAQGVGFFVTGVGVILALLGVPWAVPVAAGLAFIAAFLNAAFGYCLGCQIYLLLVRAGILGRSTTA